MAPARPGCHQVVAVAAVPTAARRRPGPFVAGAVVGPQDEGPRPATVPVPSRRLRLVAAAAVGVASAVAATAVPARGQTAQPDLLIDEALGNSPYLASRTTAFYRDITVGTRTTGLFDQRISTFAATNTFNLGLTAGSTGVWNVSGYDYISSSESYYQGALVTNGAYIGVAGTGTANMNQGTLDATAGTSAGVEIGVLAGGVGTVRLAGTFDPTIGGILNSRQLVVGRSGTGTLHIDGGKSTVTGLVILGANAGSSGTYISNNVFGSNLSNPYFLLSQSELYAKGGTWIGDAGTATVDFKDGLYDASGSAVPTVLGRSVGGSGTVNQVSGIFKTQQTIVGGKGTGTYTQIGGVHRVTDTLIVGSDSGSSGTYNVNWGFVPQPFPTPDKSSYADVTTANLVVGFRAGSTGRIAFNEYNLPTLNGTAQLSAVNAVIGYEGVAVVDQAAGALSASNLLSVGDQPGGNGTYKLRGIGQVYINRFVVGNFGTGVIEQSGGGVTPGGDAPGVVVLGNREGSRGTYTLIGGGLGEPPTAIYYGPNHIPIGDPGRPVGLTLGLGTGSTGTFNLDGGVLTASSVDGGAGISTFSFNGGTLQTGADTPTLMQGLTLAQVRNRGAVFNTEYYDILVDAVGRTATVAQPLVHSTIPGDAAVDGGVIKRGLGTLVLAGANTYTGATTVEGGTLTVSGAGTFGAAGGAFDARGGTLDLAAKVWVAGRVAIAGGTIQNGTLAATAYDGSSGTVTASLGGAAALTKTTDGTLTFGGVAANTYTGDTSVTGGTLVLAKTLPGVVNDYGAAMGGNLAVGGGGTVRYGFDSQVPDGRNVTVNAGGTLDLNGYAESVTNLTINGGSVTTAAGAGGGSNGYVNVRGTVAADGSAASAYAGTLKLEAGSAGGVRPVSVAAGGTLTVTGVVGNGDSGLAVTLSKTGPGTLVLAGANTYSGGTAVSAGTLQVGTGGTAGTLGTGTAAIPNNGALVFNRSDAVTLAAAVTGTGSLAHAGAGTLTLTGNNTYSGGTTVSGGTLRVGTGGTAGSLGAGGTVTNNGAVVFNRSDTLTVGSPIAGTGSLTQAGPGTLTLTGTNTYAGGTTIAAGTLRLADGATSGTLGTGPVANNAALAFNRSGTLTIGAAITGTGTVTQAGPGTVTFGGLNTNTYAGETRVTGGTLVLAKTLPGLVNDYGAAMAGNLVIGGGGGTVRYGFDSQVPDGRNVTVNAGGALDLNGYADTITNLSVNGGAVTTAGNAANGGGSNGYLNVRGTVAADGSANSAYAGTLKLEAATANAPKPVSVAAGGTLTVTGVVVNGDNGLPAKLEKTGPGRLVLTGVNTYTGGTTVSAGTLQIGPGGATGTGPIQVSAGASLAGSGTIAGPLTITSGGTLAPGNSPGRLTLPGGLTLDGGSTLAIELGGLAAGTGYDQVVVGGPLALDGSTLSVTPVAGFAPAPGQTFYVVDRTGTDAGPVGAFANAPGGVYTDPAGNTYRLDYVARDPADASNPLANDVSLTVLTVVPEPSTAALLAGGGLLAGLRRSPRRGDRRGSRSPM